MNKEFILRFTIIPKITETKINIDNIITFVSSLKNLRTVSLLPFHNVKEKYDRLGKNYKLPDHQTPTLENMNVIKELFEQKGFYVTI